MANDSEVFMKALDKIAKYDDIFGLDDKTEITDAIRKHLLRKENVNPVTRRITLKANVPSYVAKSKARYKELDAAAKILNRPADFVDTFVTSLGGFSGEIPAPTPDDFGWAYSYSLNGIEGTIRRKDGLYTIIINKVGLILLTATGIEPERGDDDMPRDWREREESATTTANIATYMVPLGKPMRRTPLRFKGEVEMGDCDCDDEDDECNCEESVNEEVSPSFKDFVAYLQSNFEKLDPMDFHISSIGVTDSKKRLARELVNRLPKLMVLNHQESMAVAQWVHDSATSIRDPKRFAWMMARAIEDMGFSWDSNKKLLVRSSKTESYVFPESFTARVSEMTALGEGKSKGRTLSRARRHVHGGGKAAQDEKRRAKRERRSDERKKLKSLSGKKVSDVGDVEFKKIRLDPRNVS